MTKTEKERLEKSIESAKATLANELILDPEAASQIRRMLYYYENKIKQEYKEEDKDE